MLAVGDRSLGGIVFYVNTVGGYALIVSENEVYNQAANRDGSISAISASNNLVNFGSGATNAPYFTQYIDQGDALHTVAGSDSEGFNDWFIPSKLELEYMQANKAVSGVVFYPQWYISSSLTTSNNKVYAVHGSSGSSSNFNLSNSSVYSKMVRMQSTDIGGIVVSDSDENSIAPLGTIHFGFIEAGGVILYEETQEILLRTKKAGSLIMSTYIDMNYLNSTLQPTPDSLFGTLPNLVSVNDSQGSFYYKEHPHDSTLSTISNYEAYQLTFSKKTVVVLPISGVTVATPYSHSIPAGISFLPVISKSAIDIKRGYLFEGKLHLFSSIIDVSTGSTYPGRLSTLIPGAGYVIKSNAAFTINFLDL